MKSEQGGAIAPLLVLFLEEDHRQGAVRRRDVCCWVGRPAGGARWCPAGPETGMGTQFGIWRGTVEHEKVVKLVSTRTEVAADAYRSTVKRQRIPTATYVNSLVLKPQTVFCSADLSNAR